MSAIKPRSSRAKSLPMIVDVALDPQGNTLYHVHETNNPIQEATPISTNNCESSHFLFDSVNELHSPSGSASSTHSPFADKQSSPDLNAASFVDDLDIKKEPGSAKSLSVSQEDIWSNDVEVAFEEALEIVPKCGLNKIKIAGRLCGRNELIADFILAKTGKFRSRKQVSSHIQVVKNLKSKAHLINLINDGPDFRSPEEAEENMRHFEEVFAKINLNKSLGLNSTGDAELSGSGGSLRRRSSEQLALPPKRKKSSEPFITVKNIGFTIASATGDSRPIPLTVQKDTPMKFLDLKENANISSRFPGLDEFSNTNVPLLHNMVNILSPLKLATRSAIDETLNTNFNIEVPGPTDNISVFTTVYSFGDEVLKVNEENFEANTDQPFLVKFWKCFFLQLLQLPTSLDAAFKGITVKQVIYDNTVPVTSILHKSKIMAVVLWEFSKVEDIADAISSSSRIFLPPSLGYATMTANNSNYSIRPPQATYTHSQPSPYSGNSRLAPSSVSNSSTSLHNLGSATEYSLYDSTRSQSDSAFQQLSFPGVPLSSTFSNHHIPLQQPGAMYTPLSTILDGDAARFFSEDQQLAGTHYH